MNLYIKHVCFLTIFFRSHLLSHNMKIVSVRFLQNVRCISISPNFFFLKQVSVRVRKPSVSVRSPVAKLVRG